MLILLIAISLLSGIIGSIIGNSWAYQKIEEDAFWETRQCPSCKSRDHCLFIEGVGQCGACGFDNRGES